MIRRSLIAAGLTISCSAGAQQSTPVTTLPASAVRQLIESLDAATTVQQHTWRDTAPWNADGTVNAYIEIARGDQRKWEFDMALNRRAIDRIMPAHVGGYPVNYGFVPQTISYDGDPFDVLVLGRALPGGALTRGVVVGLMDMEDEKGRDAKVVLSEIGPHGRPLHALHDGERARIGGFFSHYKRWETGKFSRVPGWGTVADGASYVRVTHAFFTECRATTAGDCRLSR